MTVIPFPIRPTATANRRETPQWMRPEAIAARSARIEARAAQLGRKGPSPLICKGAAK